MKFDIGDLVDYRHAPKVPVYTGIVLNKMWREDLGNAWYYKIYFIVEQDEAWVEEENIRTLGGFNGI